MVNLEIMAFIERDILPRYAAFDVAHNMEHVTRVIRSSVSLSQKLGADENMAYVIAAYHDLGLEGPRAIHHITSGKILKADQRLKKWFSDMQIEIMKEAVEDHRASASRAPRSIYGKIVAEADRDLNPTSVFLRTIQYGRSHYPEKTKEEHWNRFCEHMREKYSDAGYIKLWIEGSQNEKDLTTLRNIINNRKLLRETFEKLWSLT